MGLSIICACTDTSREAVVGFAKDKRWDVVVSREGLEGELQEHEYERIYVVHWHWRIPDAILAANDVIGFHCTDLPWGRGSRPLELLKALGFRETVVTGFAMDQGWDTGDILIKRVVRIDGHEIHSLKNIYRACINMINVLDIHGPPMQIKQEDYCQCTS